MGDSMRRWLAISILALSLGATPAALSATTQSPRTTAATTGTTTTPTTTVPTPTATLTPAKGQNAPASLTDTTAIPQVSAAAVAAKQHAPVPKNLAPSLPTLRADNQHVHYGLSNSCQPRFGTGVTSPICKLGDMSSRRTVVLFGDSHAQMWASAMIPIAQAQRFALVVMAKPGCAVTAIDVNTQAWPCKSWYDWALTQTRKLHPAATIVSDLITDSTSTSGIADTVADLRQELTAVPRGVLLADPPGQSQSVAACLSKAGANLGTCSTTLPSSYVTLTEDLEALIEQTHRKVIPVEQWFCSHDICPGVVDNTAVMRDVNHMTPQYSASLEPVLAPEIARVLR
jgi:hypothetical protein